MRGSGSYLSPAEKQLRYDALRACLGDAGCSAAVVVGTPHIGGKRYFRYFTDWPIQSIGGYLVVYTAGGEQAVFRASSQAFWARSVDWVKDVRRAGRSVKLNGHVLPLIRHEADAIAAVHYRIAADADYHDVAAKTRAIDQFAPDIEDLA